MRVVSWNVNGIRACVRHGFVDFVDRSGADIVGVQEVRAHPEEATGLSTDNCQRHVVGSSESRRFTTRHSSWRYPAFTINPDWTAFSVSKIPSITFCFPPNNASGPPACRLLKGGS